MAIGLTARVARASAFWPVRYLDRNKFTLTYLLVWFPAAALIHPIGLSAPSISRGSAPMSAPILIFQFCDCRLFYFPPRFLALSYSVCLPLNYIVYDLRMHETMGRVELLYVIQKQKIWFRR